MMSMMTMTMNNNDHDNNDNDEVYIHSRKRNHNNSDGFIELQQKSSSAEPLLSEAPMVLLQMPKEWFDLNKRLPTDKEFHQWIRQQIQHEKMQRRRGRRHRHRHHHHFDDNDEEQKSNSFDDDGSSSNSTTNKPPPPPPPHQEVLSAVGDAIKEASENLLEGIKIIQQEQQSRKEYNDIMKYNPHDDDDVNLLLLGERPGFAINNFESDCFPSLGKNNSNHKRRESVVVGMELPVMS